MINDLPSIGDKVKVTDMNHPWRNMVGEVFIVKPEKGTIAIKTKDLAGGPVLQRNQYELVLDDTSGMCKCDIRKLMAYGCQCGGK